VKTFIAILELLAVVVPLVLIAIGVVSAWSLIWSLIFDDNDLEVEE
jgi:hypothetical protein